MTHPNCTQLRLYVWDDTTDLGKYSTQGILYALAYYTSEARKLVIQELKRRGDWRPELEAVLAKRPHRYVAPTADYILATDGG